MAKLETVLKGDFDLWLKKIEDGICYGSVTATFEGGSDFRSADGKSRCSVRVFERYSAIGDNRVSLNVTLFQGEDGVIHCSGISSGGSQATLFKINTFGEKAFLDKLSEVLRKK